MGHNGSCTSFFTMEKWMFEIPDILIWSTIKFEMLQSPFLPKVVFSFTNSMFAHKRKTKKYCYCIDVQNEELTCFTLPKVCNSADIRKSVTTRTPRRLRDALLMVIRPHGSVFSSIWPSDWGVNWESSWEFVPSVGAWLKSVISWSVSSADIVFL